MRKFEPLSFLFGTFIGVFATGVLILGLFFPFNGNSSEVVEPAVERCIGVIPREATIVHINVLPIFVQGLAQGDPEVIETPKPTNDTPKTVVQIKECALTSSNGRVQGPTNVETYYNLSMTKVIKSMRNRGYSEEDYPYHVRDDGVKMLGDYVMVAADLNIHPKGTIVETSLGQGLVCDTGEFTDDIYDIATNW